ncbi:MAG: roadblock/LC7 domain-containing protein [Deinococcales bacterium]
MSKYQKLSDILLGLHENLPDFRGSLIASTDGLPIAHTLATDEEVNSVAAMAAAALGLGKRITQTLHAGSLGEMQIMGTDSQIFIYATGGRGILALMAKKGSNVGLINLEARGAVNDISRVLEAGS